MPDSPSSSAGVGRAQTVEGGGGGLFLLAILAPLATEDEGGGGRENGGEVVGRRVLWECRVRLYARGKDHQWGLPPFFTRENDVWDAALSPS